MKGFAKGILILLGLIIGIPLMILVLCTLMGFGAVLVAVPEVALGIIAILLVISLPGLIVGLIAGSHKD